MLTSAYSLYRLPGKALSVSISFALTGRWVPGSQGTYIPGRYWLFTDRPISRSPRIRALTFTAQPHHLRWPLDHAASLSCASSPPAYASYDVLVHQLADLLQASFRPLLTDWPLPFASSYRLITNRLRTVIFLQRTFTSLVNAHVGRTQCARVGRFAALRLAPHSLYVMCNKR